MSARKMRRARTRALAAGTAVSLAAVVAPSVAWADSLVTNSNDSGPGSLRQALNDSNAGPDADTITFAPSVTGTIAINSELTANYATKIDGPGASSLTVRAPSSRVLFFYAFADGTLEIEGITLTGTPPGALTPGAGVSANCAGANGTLLLRDAAITGSSTGNSGGAVFSDGCDVSLVRSSITGNSTSGTGDGGGILLTDAPGGGVADRLSVVDSRVSGNTTGDDGAGIFVDEAPAAVDITRSTISGNRAVGSGCACGGGLFLAETGPVTIDSSTFSANASDAGGGMLVAESASFAMRNTTVTGNSGQGGGLYFENQSGSPFTIANSTIAGNTAGDSEGGGIYSFGFPASSDLALSSTIVAGNTADTDPDIHNAMSGSGDIFAAHSVIGTATGVLRLAESAPGTNKLNTGPIELAPLADNGGPTQTMLPALGGPAIDAGVANGLTTDQRGLPRTVDQPLVPNGSGSDGTDIGAVELADSEFSGASLSAKKKQKQKGKKVKVVVSAGAAEPATASTSGTVKLGKKRLNLAVVTAGIEAGTTAKLKLKPKGKRATKKIAKALAKGKKAKASVTVAFTDTAGNGDQETTTVKLVGKKKR